MPKLPADLPENWTQGQTISPNGTEVGMTKQHGYNYLMKQVNDTQTEVNDINTALTDVAQQATVEEINNKIGTEGDADTQPTLFGRLAQLKKVLLEKLAELLTKVTRIDGKIGKSTDDKNADSIFGKIAAIKKDVESGIVYVTSDNIRKTIINREVSNTGKYYSMTFLGYFYAKRTGFVKLTASTKSTSGNIYINGRHGGVDKNIHLPYFGDDRNKMFQAGDVMDTNESTRWNFSTILTGKHSTTFTRAQAILSVQKDTLYLFAMSADGSGNVATCNNFTVSYDEVEGDSL